MGAGINDTILWLHKIDAAILIEMQLKLQYLHTWELTCLPQLLHLIGNNPQVLSHNRNIPNILANNIEESLARAWLPHTMLCCLGITINLPEGLKASEMVNTDNIHLTHQITETTNPPIITILLHNLPVVLRVAPQLASLAEVIWRYTSHLIWSAILIQLKELLMRPGIGTIQRNKDWHIP